MGLPANLLPGHATPGGGHADGTREVEEVGGTGQHGTIPLDGSERSLLLSAAKVLRWDFPIHPSKATGGAVV